MTSRWMGTVLLAAALAAGCGETTTEPQASDTAPAVGTTEDPAKAEMADAHALSAVLSPTDGIDSNANGAAAIVFTPSTGLLEYTVTYSGLSGPAVAAHIHGPADPGANAPPVVPFADSANPISGTATLTASQAVDLMAGKYYVNVHTAANPGGEIRGQILMAH